MSSEDEVPLVATAGPSGHAATVRTVALVLRMTSLALFLGGGLLVAFSKSLAAARGLSTLIILGGVLVGFALSFLRIITLDRYVLRRIGRADVFADKVIAYKNDLAHETPWSKVTKVVVKRDFVQLVRKGELWGSGLFALPLRDPALGAAIVKVWEDSKTPRRPAAPGAAAPAAPVPATTSPGQRLLVAGGGEGWKRTKNLLNLALVAVYLTALFRDWLRRHYFPWMPRVSTGTWEVDFLILIVSFRIVRGALVRFMNARIGRAEFFADRIQLYAGDDATTLGWGELRGFDDGSSDFVRLVRREPRRGETLAIPTPGEDIRVKVLALLEERGVPRCDARTMVG